MVISIYSLVVIVDSHFRPENFAVRGSADRCGAGLLPRGEPRGAVPAEPARMRGRPSPQPSEYALSLSRPLSPAEESSRPARDGRMLDVIHRAEALKIPWERLLLDEIHAEKILRRHAADAGDEMPLATALLLLPSSFLKSWRVRDQIHSLSCEARGASFRSAISELRMVFRRLSGQLDSSRDAFVGHLWLAYRRILLLQRVCRAARKSRGTNAARLAFICSTTGGSFDDAAWAVCQEDSQQPGHRLDAAVRKVREEGFQIPRASTEARSFARLRRIVRASPLPHGRRSSRGRAENGELVPRRVALTVDAI
jgi:hypothetical protein